MDNELNKKILITGATGFIGQHLVRALSQQGTHIYALTRTASNIFDNDNSVEEFIADITKPLTIPEGVTTIYHCAGVINDLKNMEAVNIGGTRNIVTATLQKDCKLIYVSSAGTVGKTKEKILDERTPCHPQNAYEISKYKAEQIVLAGIKRGLKAHILRPVTIFGVKDNPETDSFFHLLKSMRNGLYKNIGHGMYNIVHINEVVKALEILGEIDIPYGDTYIAGNAIAYEDMDRLVKNIPPTITKKTQTIPYPIAIVVTAILTACYTLINKKGPLTFSRLKALTSKKVYSQQKLIENTSFKNSLPVEEYLKIVCKDYIGRSLLS
ncbi:MAG: NAD-dependent epimerase/dehydratase family protein [Patescibacteria group bacterium]